MTPKCPDCGRDQDDCTCISLETKVSKLEQQLASCQAALADTEALEICTGERLAKVEQQLAAALAACKLKDEELEKIRGHIGLYNLFSCVGSDSYDPECADLNAQKCREIAKEALAIQPDDAALKTWLVDHACEAIAENGAPARWWWSDYGLSLPVGTKLYSQKGLVEK